MDDVELIEAFHTQLQWYRAYTDDLLPRGGVIGVYFQCLSDTANREISQLLGLINC